MMKFGKFLVTTGAALAMIWGISAMPVMAMEATSTVAAPQALESDARAQLDKAFDSLSEFNQGSMLLHVKLSGPLMYGDLEGTLAFVSAPFFEAKGTVNVEMAASEVSVACVNKIFYLRESAKNFTCYYPQKDDNWAKFVMAKKEEETDKLDAAFDKEWMTRIKAVRLGNREGSKQSYLVTMDGNKVYPYLANLLEVKTTGEKAKNDALNQALANLGDVSWEITIDEDNHLLSDFHADLTEPLRSAATAVIKNSKESKKRQQQMLNVIDNSTMEITIHSEKFDKVPNLTVPAEISLEAKAEKPVKS